MNVIVANEQHTNLMNNLDVDIIKSLSGTYTCREIVEMFSSFFYSKMILDVTAIKDYDSIDTFSDLVRGLGAEKIVFLLPQGSVLCTPSFLAKLIDLGIYNFTTNLAGIKYLLNKPNTLKDVEHIKNLAEAQKRKIIERQQAEAKAKEEAEVKARAEAEAEARAKEDAEAAKKNIFQKKNKIENIQKNIDVSSDSVDDKKVEETPVVENEPPKRSLVIGVKNVTEHAGASTLIYMLKREISLNFGRDSVIAVEIDNNDFQFFNDKTMVSIKQSDISNFIDSNNQFSFILVDLNDIVDYSFCNEVLYLVEPSVIKLNKLVRRNKNIFSKLADQKVILNKSLLLNNDVADFENEAGVKIFYHFPPLNDRNRNAIINDFLSKLGIFSVNRNSVSDKIFGLFRR